MTEDEKIEVVYGYIETAHGESRQAAAETYLADDATITINGERMSVAEYSSRIEESDRFFRPEQTEILETVVQQETVAILFRSTLKQAGAVYGIEPDGEPITQEYAVFHEIADGEIVRLDIVVDEASKLQQLGLLSDDPTKEQLQNQYYEVLNRVLRHDLRNRLNVIRLVADSLADDTIDDPEVAGVKIRSVVDDLLQTTDKARALEQLAIDASVEPTSFRIDSLVDRIVQKYNENTDITCHTRYPDTEEPVITTDKRLLWNALNELIENALLYNDEDDPTVTVEVHSTEDSRYAYEFRVEDDGPGLPAAIRQPILENRETKLLHGSGIGLWIMKWCLTRLDGDVAFEQPDAGGTCIRLFLPNLE